MRFQEYSADFPSNKMRGWTGRQWLVFYGSSRHGNLREFRDFFLDGRYDSARWARTPETYWMRSRNRAANIVLPAFLAGENFVREMEYADTEI